MTDEEHDKLFEKVHREKKKIERIIKRRNFADDWNKMMPEFGTVCSTALHEFAYKELNLNHRKAFNLSEKICCNLFPLFHKYLTKTDKGSRQAKLNRHCDRVIEILIEKGYCLKCTKEIKDCPTFILLLLEGGETLDWKGEKYIIKVDSDSKRRFLPSERIKEIRQQIEHVVSEGI